MDTEKQFSLLIVDDDADLGSNMKDILEAEGYRAEYACDGRSASGVCREGNFDLALVDIALPDMTGMDLISKLSEICAGTEYIVVTGHASLDTAIEAVGHPNVIGYEVKPLDMTRLLNLIRQVFERNVAQDKLKTNEERLRLILEQMPCLLWTVDSDLKVSSAQGVGGSSLASGRYRNAVGHTLQEYFDISDSDYTPIAAHMSALKGTPVAYDVELPGNKRPVVFSCHVEPLRDRTGALIGAIGIALDITERKVYEEKLKSLSRRLVEAQEEERRAIALELHDQTVQSLAALRLFLERALRSPQEKVSPILTEAQAVLNEVISQVRDMSLDLRPSMLDDLGLLPALLWHVERYINRTGIQVKFEHFGLQRDFSPELRTVAYRVIQESLNNVARHAGATEAKVNTWAYQNELHLRIEDNGKGFDPCKVLTGRSCGLEGMRERVTLIGGKLNVESTPGSGTCITATLPLKMATKKRASRRSSVARSASVKKA